MRLSPHEDSDCRVFDIQRFSIHDGPGIRTTVFLEGCPLRCSWCQNPEAFLCGRARSMSAGEIVSEVLKDAEYFAVSGGGLTVSGGEPLLFPTPVKRLLEAAKVNELHTCVQTCGAVAQSTLAAVLRVVDLFQFDLKHMDTSRHRTLTGAGNEQISRNAVFLLESGANVEFRMPLVPGINDDEQNLERTAAFLRLHGVNELCLVPYHRMYIDKYTALGMKTPNKFAGVRPATSSDLARATCVLAQHDVVATVEAAPIC